jgi:sugar-phosphatase
LVAPELDPLACLSEFNALEDEDVRTGIYSAFDGAMDLLRSLPLESWAVVTSNYEHRVRGRFARAGLPIPTVIVDASSEGAGKPAPDPYLRAADRLGVNAAECLVIEDSPSGVQAGINAGMTVWSVNSPEPVSGSHRHFVTLRAAVPHVLAFAADGQMPPV